MFQSLLSWMGHRNWAASRPAPDGPAGVSILVVVDGSPQPGPGVGPRPGQTCRFNPCCRGWVTATSGRRAPASRRAGFNPCCRGWVTATSGPGSTGPWLNWVSILVVVDGSPQLGLRGRAVGVEVVSILVVVDGSPQPDGRRTDAVDRDVSILVVVDGSPQRRSQPSAGRSMFQSLLSWMGHRNGRISADCTAWRRVFQSLLSWMGHRNALIGRLDPSDATVFQSLLSWMGHRNPAGPLKCDTSYG